MVMKLDLHHLFPESPVSYFPGPGGVSYLVGVLESVPICCTYPRYLRPALATPHCHFHTICTERDF